MNITVDNSRLNEGASEEAQISMVSTDKSELHRKKRNFWKSGLARLSNESKRTTPVKVSFNDSEIKYLDELSTSVGMRRGQYCRAASLNRLPPTIPELNKVAWLELSNFSADIKQTICELNINDCVEMNALLSDLSHFRQLLIRVSRNYETQNHSRE